MSEPMDLIYKDPKYPSSKVVNGLSMAGPRAHLRGMGLVNEELAKPFIGVINTYNEMHPGHIHLNRIGQLVKDGVREAGGVPFEVNTISLRRLFPGPCGNVQRAAQPRGDRRLHRGLCRRPPVGRPGAHRRLR